MPHSVDLDQLQPYVRWAAKLLTSLSPQVEVISGRRSLTDQARAMAQNVHSIGRNYVRDTYRSTDLSAAVQQAIDQHPEAISVEDIAAVILAVLDSREDGKSISKHCKGLAFDLRPMQQGPEHDFVLRVIRSLPGLERFLTREAGAVRWHLQFHDYTRSIL